MGRRLLSVLLLAAAPGLAQTGAFSNEGAASFFWEGGRADRPLVALGGTPVDTFSYRGDSTAYSLEARYTRFFCPVPDDGKTPFALLPYVARRSSATLRVGLVETSRDSVGAVQGVGASITSSLSGDAGTRSGSLEGEWFFLDGTALRASAGFQRFRETDAATSVELPSGRGELGTTGTRTSRTALSLGVAQRLGEHQVAAAFSWTGSDTQRTDGTVFTGDVMPRTQELSLAGDTYTVSASARLLFLSRRLTVDVAGFYAETDSTVDQTVPTPRPWDEPQTLQRQIGGAATWAFTRALGATASLSYGTSGSVQGIDAKRRSQSVKTVVVGVGVVCFVSPGASVSLGYTRTSSDTVEPPETDTFQRLTNTLDRVTASAAVRF